MKYYFKLFMLLPVGLTTAIIIYPFVHETSHSICALLFGADIVNFALFPLPNVTCNSSALSALQLFFIAVGGPLIPFILSVAIRSTNFWINYIKGLMIGISSLSFVISILGFLFDWKIVKEQDDIVRCASLLPNGVTISIIICSIGIAVAICELVRMKKSHNCHKYFEYVK